MSPKPGDAQYQYGAIEGSPVYSTRKSEFRGSTQTISECIIEEKWGDREWLILMKNSDDFWCKKRSKNGFFMPKFGSTMRV